MEADGRKKGREDGEALGFSVELGILSAHHPLPFDRQSYQSNKTLISSDPFHLLVV